VIVVLFVSPNVRLSEHAHLLMFDSQVAPQNDYGKRAHEDLIVTRGAGFRKEKNKKKKGSYRGGEITVCFIQLLKTPTQN